MFLYSYHVYFILWNKSKKRYKKNKRFNLCSLWSLYSLFLKILSYKGPNIFDVHNERGWGGFEICHMSGQFAKKGHKNGLSYSFNQLRVTFFFLVLNSYFNIPLIFTRYFLDWIILQHKLHHIRSFSLSALSLNW